MAQFKPTGSPVKHTFNPVFDKNSKILILGTMPSPKSREAGFYYSHPQNRFWKTIAAVFNAEVPVSIEQKTNLLYANNIAVWDVLASCKISGADDSSIKDIIVNDFSVIFEAANIKAVFTTGKKATELFKKHCQDKYGFKPVYLPSTSAANCKISQKELEAAYRVVAEQVLNGR